MRVACEAGQTDMTICCLSVSVHLKITWLLSAQFDNANPLKDKRSSDLDKQHKKGITDH